MKQAIAENYIFDVDGTLYSQKNVRIKMFFRLVRFYGLRMHRLKELHALYCFRKLREKEDCRNKNFEDLFLLLSKKCSLNTDMIAHTVQKWMFSEPLDLLRKYAYTDVINFINNQKNIGKYIVIYSDYPAIDKLNALGVNYDKIFVSGENEITEQKPSMNAMQTILNITKINTDQTIYVGDRNDKDKLSAEFVNIKYYDIRNFRKFINS